MNQNSIGDWINGFNIQSNNIVLRVKFKRNIPFSNWVESSFYIRSNAVEPGKAVILGTNDLYFCSPNQVQTVTLANFPADTNNQENCFWHYNWIWQLPSGWKITSTNGNINTATNTFSGGKTVKIQAPAILNTVTNLTVSSESSWPWPVSTTSQIIAGNPPSLQSISHNGSISFPSEICYQSSGGEFSDFYGGIGSGPEWENVSYYEWQSNAGTVHNPINYNSAYSGITINNPGSNRYVRVRAINNCGVASAWYTQYFNVSYNPSGCSGGGFFSLMAYPNPTSDELTVELNEESNSSSQKRELEMAIEIFDKDMKTVYKKKFKGKKYKINTRPLKKGNYILRVTKGKITKSKHIIIQ